MAVTTTRRRGIIKNRGGWGWECLGQNSFSRHIFAKYFSFIVMLSFFHSRSRSRVFLGMIASDSHSRNVGTDFFHSLPEFWECFSIPWLGNDFIGPLQQRWTEQCASQSCRTFSNKKYSWNVVFISRQSNSQLDTNSQVKVTGHHSLSQFRLRLEEI